MAMHGEQVAAELEIAPHPLARRQLVQWFIGRGRIKQDLVTAAPPVQDP